MGFLSPREPFLYSTLQISLLMTLGFLLVVSGRASSGDVDFCYEWLFQFLASGTWCWHSLVTSRGTLLQNFSGSLWWSRLISYRAAGTFTSTLHPTHTHLILTTPWEAELLFPI